MDSVSDALRLPRDCVFAALAALGEAAGEANQVRHSGERPEGSETAWGGSPFRDSNALNSGAYPAAAVAKAQWGGGSRSRPFVFSVALAACLLHDLVKIRESRSV